MFIMSGGWGRRFNTRAPWPASESQHDTFDVRGSVAFSATPLPLFIHDALRALTRTATGGFLVFFRLHAPFCTCTYAERITSTLRVSQFSWAAMQIVVVVATP